MTHSFITVSASATVDASCRLRLKTATEDRRLPTDDSLYKKEGAPKSAPLSVLSVLSVAKR